MNRTKRIVCAMIAIAITSGIVFADESELPQQNIPAETEELPTAIPTESPTENPTENPTETPTQTPTEQPTTAPTEAPEPTYKIEIDGAQRLQDDVWQLSDQSAEEAVTFRWTAIETAITYRITIRDSGENEVYTASQAENTLTLPISALPREICTMTVLAYAQEEDEEPIAQMQIRFTAAQQTQQFPDGGFPSGGFPSGSFAGGTMPEGMMQEEQGFHVTPGEALTDSHTSGTGTMLAFGAVEIAFSSQSMTKLTLGETELDIVLDDAQNAFYVSQQDDVLVLTPAAEGNQWSVNGYALKVLNRSGIESVRLVLGEDVIEIATNCALQGTVFGKLSAQGYVSKDYTWNVTTQGMTVQVAGVEYTINENNELVGE